VRAWQQLGLKVKTKSIATGPAKASYELSALISEGLIAILENKKKRKR
jgi:hypothetical protein